MSVIEKLKKYILVDGFHVVVDLKNSKDSWIRDAETGKEYLDCYSQFASQPFGWNYEPFMNKDMTRLRDISHIKLANPDMYSHIYLEFIETFAGITPDFDHYFFIDGGAMSVENALKAAFDWKSQMDPRHQKHDGANFDVIHLYDAFHGRSGYALSLTNSGDIKTKWFPKFNWSRVTNPMIRFPLDDNEEEKVIHWEEIAYTEIDHAVSKNNVAAMIIEPIQGEGGDNHFRPQFISHLRKLADEHEFMLIFDEVQTGMGLTGKWWAYEHFGVKPDLMCFGKKSQVCGFCSDKRIDEVKNNVFVQSGRINSTWGGNFVDMERARLIIETIKDQKLVENSAVIGEYFLNKLKNMDSQEMSCVRGRGLMIAFDLPKAERRNYVMERMHDIGLLALKSGERSIRFRPPLTFSRQDVDVAVDLLKKSLV